MIPGVMEQAALLDLNGRELNAAFVDESQPLFIANNPLHWQAHKLQLALARMDAQLKTNPAQFNATVYFSTIDKLAGLMQQINDSKKVEQANGKILDEGNVVSSGNGSAAAEDSETESISMDT